MLWLSIYALLTAIVVNLVIPATSQGSELVDSLADAQNRALAIVSLVASAAYCAAACGTSAALVTHYGRLRDTTEATVLRARRAVPYWLAIAVLLSCSALILPLGVAAMSVPSVLILGLLALPVAGDGRVAGPTQKPRTIGIVAACLAAIGACVCIAVIAFPVSASRTIGAWPIVYLASGFWTIVGSVVFIVLPKRAGLPALMFLPLLIFAGFSWSNDNHTIREGPASRGTSQYTPVALDAHFDSWLRKTCSPSPRPCPVYLAAAQGGGARSAYWTASILRALDHRTGGTFSRHLFAISAVSGGALGAAAYVAAKADESEGNVSDSSVAMRAFLGDDYLSPIVGALAFPDFIARFAPIPLPRFDRATAFELALERSWRSAFHTDRFSQDINALYAGPGGGDLPSLLLNATNVETGKRFVVSNLAFGPADRGDAYYAYDTTAAYHIASMPLSTAVHLGARFPYLSPHGVLAESGVPNSAGAPWGRLVDGGYYDNSGTATLSDLLDALVRHVAREPVRNASVTPEFIVLVISNDVDAAPAGPGDRVFSERRLPRMPPSHMMHVYEHLGDVPQRSLELSELDSPIETLLAAREAHADAEIRHLAQRVEDLATEQSLHCAMAHLGAKAACTPVPVFAEFSYARALGSVEFSGLMQKMSRGSADRHAIIQLIRPGLGWTLSARSRHALDVLSVQAVERQAPGTI